MRQIGLLLGSFDPIHKGHLSIASWALSGGGFDEVWLVISPQNPMKPTMAAPYEHRRKMAEIALQGRENIYLCTVEEELTAPFYTINTIELLKERYEDATFSILCGTDVKKQCEKWHRSEELQTMVEFVEYPRYANDNLPFVDVSSSEVRCGEKLGEVDPLVLDYMKTENVYCEHLERGRRCYGNGDICGAINEWNRCKSEPHKAVAQSLKDLANGIMAYRYTEIYNP